MTFWFRPQNLKISKEWGLEPTETSPLEIVICCWVLIHLQNQFSEPLNFWGTELTNPTWVIKWCCLVWFWYISRNSLKNQSSASELLDLDICQERDLYTIETNKCRKKEQVRQTRKLGSDYILNSYNMIFCWKGIWKLLSKQKCGKWRVYGVKLSSDNVNKHQTFEN